MKLGRMENYPSAPRIEGLNAPCKIKGYSGFTNER